MAPNAPTECDAKAQVKPKISNEKFVSEIQIQHCRAFVWTDTPGHIQRTVPSICFVVMASSWRRIATLGIASIPKYSSQSFRHGITLKIGRCDPGYECPAEHRPPCYEGEIRAIASTFPSNSANAKCETDYELCRDGRFLRQSCPYKEYFTGGRCQVKDARCGETGQDGNGGAGNGAAASSQKCQASVVPESVR